MSSIDHATESNELLKEVMHTQTLAKIKPEHLEFLSQDVAHNARDSYMPPNNILLLRRAKTTQSISFKIGQSVFPRKISKLFMAEFNYY